MTTKKDRERREQLYGKGPTVPLKHPNWFSVSYHGVRLGIYEAKNRHEAEVKARASYRSKGQTFEDAVYGRSRSEAALRVVQVRPPKKPSSLLRRMDLSDMFVKRPV